MHTGKTNRDGKLDKKALTGKDRGNKKPDTFKDNPDRRKFTKEDIIIPDATIHYIIDNYCMKEDGVRNLKRCLEIIYTKLNLYRLMKPGSNLFEEDMSLKVEFPFTVTKQIVDKLIKKESDGLETWINMFL